MFPFLELNKSDLFDILRVLLVIVGIMAWAMLCAWLDNPAQSMFVSFWVGLGIYAWWKG